MNIYLWKITKGTLNLIEDTNLDEYIPVEDNKSSTKEEQRLEGAAEYPSK